ncbi:MAG: hypothetical protein JW862_04240 [Anaerolineales bacterium]|nr:hypothetical protein [Anaerolineales bacterium]
MMKRIFRWLAEKIMPQTNSAEMVTDLLKKLIATEEQEISCEDVLLLLAEFTEMKQRGADVAHLMPLVQKHLDMCQDCREEHEALFRALEFEKQYPG